MKNYLKYSIFLLISLINFSCISLKDIQLMQPDENLKLNDKGYIDYNIPEYHIQSGDIILINVSSSNPSSLGILAPFLTSANRTFNAGQNPDGVLVRDNGVIELPRIGEIHIEGLTIKQAREKIEKAFYKIYTPESTYIDVNLAGVEYTIIGEANSGVYRANKRDLTIIEAFAKAGTGNIYANLQKIRIIRSTPEGTKQVYVDLTKDTIMNSEFYWVQNNDIIVVNPRKEKIWGIGLNPLSVVTTVMGALATILGVYLFFDRL